MKPQVFHRKWTPQLNLYSLYENHWNHITIYENSLSSHPAFLPSARTSGPPGTSARLATVDSLPLLRATVLQPPSRTSWNHGGPNGGLPTVSPDPWNSTSGGFVLKHFSTKPTNIESSFDASVHLHLGCWFPFLNRSISPWSVMWFISFLRVIPQPIETNFNESLTPERFHGFHRSR